MTLLVLSLLLAAAASAWVIYPIVTGRAARLADVESAGVLNAEARRSVALASLREVEYDREAGKLDDTDYRALRDRLAAEAVQAIHAADRVHASADEDVHLCGFRNPQGSRFCGGCGTRLT